MSSIATTLSQNASSFFSDEGFLVYLDDHVPLMREANTISVVAIAPTLALKYRHDFLGLLNHLQVPYPCHTAAARLNRITANRLPQTYNIESILVPTAEALRAMYNSWKSTTKVRK